MIPNKRDHTKLICDIGELTNLFTDSSDLENFLQKTVEMIAHHMYADVCSIYLYYADTRELVLNATTGLNPDFIGNISLKLGEGLSGLALKELRPICERQASTNPNFKFFQGLGEEKFESFLAVPISRGTTKIGTMVVQNTKKNFFQPNDIHVLKAITTQLANTIEMTRLILSIEENHDLKRDFLDDTEVDFSLIKGKVGSTGGDISGFVMAKSYTLSDSSDTFSVSPEQFPACSLDDFYAAAKRSEQQLEQMQKRVEEQLSDVASLIFTAQILMLKDKAFMNAMVDLIKNDINPPEAVIQITKLYIEKFKKLPQSYLREKSHDVFDVGKRLLENLTGQGAHLPTCEGHIVIAPQLLPSDVLKLASQNVCGVILLSGGVTGHVAILARSLALPVVIVNMPQIMDIPHGTKILFDTVSGNIYVDPSKQIIKTYQDKKSAGAHAQIKEGKVSVSKITKTRDDVKINLLANVNLLSDLRIAKAFRAQGVGLYRSEFPFIVRRNFPSEEEQFLIYQKLIDIIDGQPLTFRTLDIGGDKVLSYFQDYSMEKNPFLGMRSIRFSLKHPEIFEQQIRAILRAAVKADIRIMFPMISSVDEFLEAKKMVTDCIQTLHKEKIPCHNKPQIGLMIELPSVLEVIEELAKEADFFSIGTNDLIQYMLAVDRTNDKVSDLYLAHHPAIIRALKKIVDAATKFKKDVSICGDMVHQEKYLPYLIGIGLRTFSINPSNLPQIQTAIKQIDSKKAEESTKIILTKTRLKDVEQAMGLD